MDFSRSPGFVSQDVPQVVLRRANVQTIDQAVGVSQTATISAKSKPELKIFLLVE